MDGMGTLQERLFSISDSQSLEIGEVLPQTGVAGFTSRRPQWKEVAETSLRHLREIHLFESIKH